MKKLIFKHLWLAACYTAFCINICHHAYWAVSGFIIAVSFRFFGEDLLRDLDEYKDSL